MKVEYVEYLLRLSLIWACLLLFYQWSLSRRDNWSLKRIFLLGAYLLGWLIPLLPAIIIAPSKPEWSISFSGQGTAFIFVENTPEMGAQGISWSLQHIFWAVYLIGVLSQAGYLLFHFVQLIYWKKQGDRSYYGSYAVIRHKSVASPFAALGTIFLPFHQDPATEEMICLHEAVHLKNYHNIERIPFLLGSILLWFHPLQWIFSRWQRELQEYEADEGVIRQFPLRQYGTLLIQASMSCNKYQGLGLFSSPLKKRINMMTKRKNHTGLKKSHYLLLFLLLGLLVVNCSDLVKQAELTENTELLVTEVDLGPSLKVSSPDNDEVSPQKILLEKVYREIKYPAAARNAGVEGTFKATFIIDEDGKMQDLSAEATSNDKENTYQRIVIVGYGNTSETGSVSQKSSELLSVLGGEIERTLLTLPDWNPAQHEGKAVPVKMNLLFQYKLE